MPVVGLADFNEKRKKEEKVMKNGRNTLVVVSRSPRLEDDSRHKKMGKNKEDHQGEFE